MEIVYERVAAIDVGKKIIAVAVRTPGQHPGKRRQQVRKYNTFHQTLAEMVAWLVAEGVTHVTMEATGIYWKPIFHALCAAERPMEVLLVNARHVKNVPGRKSDALDAVWLAELPTRVPQLNGAPGHADRHRRRSPTCTHPEAAQTPGHTFESCSNRPPAEMQTRHVHGPSGQRAHLRSRRHDSQVADLRQEHRDPQSRLIDHGQTVSIPSGTPRLASARGIQIVLPVVRSSATRARSPGTTALDLRRCWLLDTRLSVGDHPFLQLNRPFPCPGA